MENKKTATIYNSIFELIDGENYLDLPNFCIWTETTFKALERYYKVMRTFGHNINVSFARKHSANIEALLWQQKDFKDKFTGYVHTNSIAFEGYADVSYMQGHRIKVTWTSTE